MQKSIAYQNSTTSPYKQEIGKESVSNGIWK